MKNQPTIKTENSIRTKEIYKITLYGSIVNIVLIIFKFIAGILGRSSAMLADAVHSLSDFITDIIVVVFVKVSSHPYDDDHTYGHGKFETLATLLIGVILFLVSLGIIWTGCQAIVSVLRGEILPPLGTIALIGAIVSIIFKEILFRYTIKKGREIKSDVVIANAWHHRSDAFSSIAAAIGIGGAMLLGEQWRVLDPLVGVLVGFFIIKTAYILAKPALEELLEKALPNETIKEVENIVYSFGEVSNLHHLHTRKIGNYSAIEFHIRMDGNKTLIEAHELVSKIERKLRDRYGEDTYLMIHMEPFKEQITKNI